MAGTGEKKRLFVTGATGYIGTALCKLALKDGGYDVYGLARSDEGEEKLKDMGVNAVRGDLKSLDVLSEQSSKADIVIHLAFIHDFTLDYNIVLETDGSAVDAMAQAIKGTDKPLVVTSGVATVEQDNLKDNIEDKPFNEASPLPRWKSEKRALDWASKGVRVVSIRLPPFVFGHAGKGFFLWLTSMTVQAKKVYMIGDGSTYTSSVYIDDVTQLYLLAAEKAKAGDVFNCSATHNITAKQLLEALAKVTGYPLESTNFEEAAKAWSPVLALVLSHPIRPSNLKAREQLGWSPEGPDILTDITEGSYTPVVKAMAA
ncbi:hypothetical protein V1511DRAFT_485683 [Dipodascopsis uninucleata]